MKTIILLFCLTAILTANAQTFTKITTGPVANTPRDSRSVNWVDIDNDGYIDLFISNGHSTGDNNLLYRNDGNGNFVPVTGDTIVSDSLPSVGATWADMDNDGDSDCFVVNWYNKVNLLYENDGAGHFTLLNAGTISTELSSSETASWGDYDRDGLVDLYVTNSGGNLKNFLYHNDGNHVFTKILTGPQSTDAYASRGATWTDYDLDWDPDLFVCNEYNTDENLYRNNMVIGVFESVPANSIGVTWANTMSSSFADYDNDGDIDFVLANYGTYNRLFRSNNDGTYTIMSADTVCTTPSNSFGTSWGDIDNDGDLDLYVTNAFVSGQQLHNFLFMNNGDGTFTRDGNSTLVTDLGWSYGCAFGDYDNDGFLDLAVANCYDAAQANSLFHNDGNANHWLEIHCTGVVSNRSALGAKVYVTAMINGVEVTQMREISAQSGYCGQNMLTAHFGLGDATEATHVRIDWPSGMQDTYDSVAVDVIAQAVEGDVLGVGEVEYAQSAGSLESFPNPFSETSTIAYTAAKAENVTVAIYQQDGRLVQQLFSGKLEAGKHQWNWNGTDTHHRKVSTGMYLCVVRSGNTEISRRILYAPAK